MGGYLGSNFMLRFRSAILCLGCSGLLAMYGCTPAGAAPGPPTAQASQIGLSGPTLPNPGNPGINRQQQIQAGVKAAQQVYQQMPILPAGNPVSQYVSQLGARLVAQIPSQYSWPYQFHVVAQKEINAFALPGGQVFINLGAINAASNTAELAGVMAHEMSHVYLQHSAKMAVQAQRTQGLAAVGAGILGAILGNGAAGQIATTAIGVGANLYELKYSREDEAQADATGAIIMYKAGYDPRAMAQFFQKLESQGGPGAPQFLSDHPNPGNRVASVDREIANWPPENYRSDNRQFLAARSQSQHLQAYTAQQIAANAKSGYWGRLNQKNGAVFSYQPIGSNASSSVPAGNAAPAAATPTALSHVSYRQVRPSSRMQPLQNSVFSLNYPANWQAATDPNTGAATLAPPAGTAGSTVAYGVVIGGSDGNSTSLSQSTQALVQSLEQSNAGMSALSNPSPVSVSGMAGESVMLRSQSPVMKNGRPVAERDWLVTVPRPAGGLLYLIFIAPESNFGKLRPTYQAMLRSLQVR